jgi:hypothetical protein
MNDYADQTFTRCILQAFQAIGFAWLLFLLLQEWRDKRRGSIM